MPWIFSLGLFLWALAGPALCRAQNGPARDAALAVRRVENGLRNPIRITGQPIRTFSIGERMSRYRVPGMSVAVIDQYEVAWARGYGFADVKGGRRVTPETLFQAASISKPISAMAALTLMADGKIALHEDVNRYLASWQVPYGTANPVEPVTLAHLLRHTAGFPAAVFPGLAAGEPVPSVADILAGRYPELCSALELEATPGSRWRYSNGGYTVVQMIIEDVTGEPFHEVMGERILQPLEMTNSTFAQPLPPGLHSRAAIGYRADGNPVEGGWLVYPTQAAGGLWTTAVDLARLALEVQKSLLGRSNRVLSRAMVDTMFTPGLYGWSLGFPLQGGYGMGDVARPGDPATRFHHTGGNDGYRCRMVAFVQGGQGAVVMTNSDQGDQLINEVLLAVAEVYDWRGLRQTERPVGEFDSSRWGKFVGRYEVSGIELTLEVIRDGDHLYLERNNSLRCELHRSGIDVYFTLDGWPDIIFVTNEADSVVAVQTGPWRARRVTAGD